MSKQGLLFLLHTVSTLLLLAVHVLASATNETEAPTEAPNDVLLCKVTLHVLEAGGSAPSAEFFGCTLVDEQTGFTSPLTYVLEGLPNTLQQACRNRLVADEVVYLSIPGGEVTDSSVIVSDPSLVEILSDRSESKRTGTLQYSQKSLGTLKVLVLRITALDSQPTFSAAQLTNYIFNDDVSLKGQMSKCSAGKLTIEPTLYGVLDVQINIKVNGLSYVDIVDAALAIAPYFVKEDVQDVQELADAVMFVVPPSSQGSWEGFGGINGKQTTYNDMWAAYVGAQMHEIGHNLGLLHANANGEEYADVTGYMGRAAQVLHYPAKCFNAQNHWYLRWFEDRSLELDVTQNGQQLLSIASFLDYPKTQPGQYVLVKIGDYYLQYNRQTSFNEDTGDMGNMLTIVKYEDGVGTSLLAGLEPGAPFWNSGDYQMVVVDVCQTVPGTDVNPDIMIVSVGVGESACPKVAPPTNPPTPSPTSAPIAAPIVETPVSSPVISAPVDNPVPQPVTSPVDAASEPSSAQVPQPTPQSQTQPFPSIPALMDAPQAAAPTKKPTKKPTISFIGVPKPTAPIEKPNDRNPFVGIANSSTLPNVTAPVPQSQGTPTRKPSGQPTKSPVAPVPRSPTPPPVSPSVPENPKPASAPTRKNPFVGIPAKPTTREKPSGSHDSTLYDVPNFPTIMGSTGGPPTRRRLESNETNDIKSVIESALVVFSVIFIGILACVYTVQISSLSPFPMHRITKATDMHVCSTTRVQPLLCEYSSDDEENGGDLRFEASNNR